MNLSISNIAWNAADDVDMLSFLKANGFSGLEIAPTRIFPVNPYDKNAEMKAFSDELYANYSLLICSMQSIWYGKAQAIFGAEQEKNELIAYTKKASDFAKSAGCGNLVFGCPKNRNMPDGAMAESAIPFFYEIAEYAHKQGNIIALEPNPVIYGTNFVNTTESAFAFVKTVASKGLKVNVDMGTIIYNSEDLSHIENNFAYVNHLHISEPGLEIIQVKELHKELAALLKRCDYKGYVSLEMKNPGDIAKVQKAALEMKEVFC